MVLAGLFFLSVTSQLFSQDDVVKERKKLMRANNKASTALKKAVAAKDFAAIEKNAKAIASQMEKLPGLFPKGSTAENSRAKMAIWEKLDFWSVTLRALILKDAFHLFCDFHLLCPGEPSWVTLCDRIDSKNQQQYAKKPCLHLLFLFALFSTYR